MISRQTIDKIFETAQIEEVLGDFVSLKKRGANYLALCPFHNEKTPSFTVSPTKGIYKCFGCGQAGNVVKFLMEHEHYAYPEALKYLAQKYHIEIEETFDTQRDKEQQGLKESYHIITEFAQQYYSNLLFESEEGTSIGLSYFKERGYREDIIKKFQLGYSLDQYDAFTDTALEKGYKLEFLKHLGLTSTKNDKNYDFFRGRIIFPIHNLSGKVIAFAGRSLKKNEKTAKYINSPESDIYHKSKIVYGIHLAKRAIGQKDECYLVEGYTDVISLHQAGIENVVASSGTSLTTDQIRLVKRYSSNIIILYDGDEAGINAASRGVELILEQGLNVKVVLLPENEDPDSYVQKAGVADFQNFLQENAKDFILFKTGFLLKDAENDPVKKSDLIKDIVQTIAKIPESIKRAVYIKQCSRQLSIDEQILISEANKELRKTLRKKTTLSQQQAQELDNIIQQTSQPQGLETDEYQEKDILRLLLEYGEKEIESGITVSQLILKEIENIQFDNPVFSNIINEFGKRKKGKEPDQNYFINHPEPEISQTAIELLADPHQLSENWEKKHDISVRAKEHNFKNDVINGINRFKLRKVMRMIKNNEQKMQECNDNEEQYIPLQKVHLKLLEWKVELSKKLSTIITNKF